MSKNLLIVESPAKAKTIEKFLGKDFTVKSCYGHIRDLEKDDMGVDVDHGFEPRYIVPDEKQKVVSELRKLAKSSEEVWLASDEDREGESISWHLCEVLDLDPATTKRIVFHEITKPAIQKAVANPRTVNMNLVNAQQARRVLDRIVGFEISPVLWRKIGRQGGLSAGRVQSVAVRLIVEKEREINAFKASSEFVVKAQFSGKDLNGKDVSFAAEGSRFQAGQQAQAFLESCIGANYTVNDIVVKPGKRSPAPPFTTSTLQQEASRKLGYGVAKTMLIAQKLYEAGHITYMRTDSVNLSDTALGAIGNAIENNYGPRYLKIRKYKNKNESAQEAHEAIRPTYMEHSSIDDAEGARLYELIWKRTIASQMADAETEKTTAKIGVSTNGAELNASGEVIKFDGFLKVYMESTDDEDEQEDGRLPNLSRGQAVQLQEMTATERYSRPSARYTEASLVKKMEELGIGRPSTYAPTISTILKRNYVEKADREGQQRQIAVYKLANGQVSRQQQTENFGAEKSKLFPTDLGFVVTDFLTRHFESVMDYNFTASIEEEFDKVAAGNKQWNRMVRDFYDPFHKDVEETLEHADRATGERFLGEHPDSRRPVFARMGRFGAMVQIGSADDEEKPLFASLRPGQSIETISLEEALTLFKLPFSLGSWNDKEVSVGVGRFGPYVKYGEEFISLPKGEDPLAVDMTRAQALIQQKHQADAPIASYEGQPVTKGKGRFGPFIKWGDLYVNVPRRYNFDHLTQQDVNELLAAKLEKEANRYIQQWPELKISIENGRWGPYIRFGKKMLKLGKPGKSKFTQEEAAVIGLDEVKAIIEAQVPGAFEKKASKAAPKKAASKAGAKKAAPKKATARKGGGR
ncbi:MAG: type I DNA topoisomerase [Chitinophagaceae bacterium]|nr:type I DNA topoisomerase [Chitinophagaceae bacterium]